MFIFEWFKDWIIMFKFNGYEFLYIIVIGLQGCFVEVQICLVCMDEIVECGFVVYWKYKGVFRNFDLYECWLDSVWEILEDL